MANVAANAAVDNICIGYDTGQDITTSDNNVIIGSLAGAAITTGGNNTIVGRGAGNDLVDGVDNVFIGEEAAAKQTSASSCVFIGKGAGEENTTGAQHVGIGALSMSYNAAAAQTGHGHTCVGYTAGYVLQGASTYNVLIGQDCGNEMTTGSYNTCVGKGSGDNITTGNGNTCVGANVQPSAVDGDNQFVFGDNISGAGDDTFRVGKSSAYISATLSGTQTFTVSSDERKKRNINDNNLGLEFINDIKTKTFQWRPANEFPEEWEAFKEDSDGNRVYDKMDTDTTQYGLIAQEVKESMGKFDADTFPGWNVDPKGIQEVSRESFVIPLIKAVQELSQQVEDLKKKVG